MIGRYIYVCIQYIIRYTPLHGNTLPTWWNATHIADGIRLPLNGNTPPTWRNASHIAGGIRLPLNGKLYNSVACTYLVTILSIFCFIIIAVAIIPILYLSVYTPLCIYTYIYPHCLQYIYPHRTTTFSTLPIHYTYTNTAYTYNHTITTSLKK